MVLKDKKYKIYSKSRIAETFRNMSKSAQDEIIEHLKNYE
jgi:hypothetical protein